jgi:hypothetical protein
MGEESDSLQNQAFTLTENCRTPSSKHNRCPTVLTDLTQNRVVLLAAESEAHTKLFRQPRFWDTAAVELSIHEEVKGAIVPFNNL